MSAIHAASTLGPPVSLSPLDWFNSALQQLLGMGPAGSYIAYAMALYALACFWVWQVKKTLENEWTTLSDWSNHIVPVCVPVDVAKFDIIQYATIGHMRMFRGRILLSWFEEAEPIMSFNNLIVHVAGRGTQYLRRTRVLYSVTAFVTMAVCQAILALVLLIWDSPNLSNPSFVPVHQYFLGAIFIWPIILFLFEHNLVPKWKRDLAEIRRQVEFLSARYPFREGRLS